MNLTEECLSADNGNFEALNSALPSKPANGLILPPPTLYDADNADVATKSDPEIAELLTAELPADLHSGWELFRKIYRKVRSSLHISRSAEGKRLRARTGSSAPKQETTGEASGGEGAKSQFDELVSMLQGGKGSNALMEFVKGAKSPFNLDSDQVNRLSDLGMPQTVLDSIFKKDQDANASGKDPLEGIKSQQAKEFQLRKEEAQMSLHEAERRNMTIAARKKSIAADLNVMNKEISEREKAQKEGRIFGMTKEQQGNLLPTEIEKQLQTDELTLLAAC